MLIAAIVIATGCGGKRSDPPLLVPWTRIGDIALGEPKARVTAEYGAERDPYGYRLHGGRVSVGFDSGRVTDIYFTTRYYRMKSGLGVGSAIPLGPCHRTANRRCEHRWRGFVWNAWRKENFCSCWTKVGVGPTSLAVATSNYLKPWFIIHVSHGRVTAFYFSLKYVD